MKHYHWIIKGNNICAWVNSGNMYSEIATVESTRAVKQLLEYAHLGEDVEHIVDRIVSGNLSDALAVLEMVKLVRETIGRTS